MPLFAKLKAKGSDSVNQKREYVCVPGSEREPQIMEHGMDNRMKDVKVGADKRLIMMSGKDILEICSASNLTLRYHSQ